jgi:hypothetical protein
MNVLIGFEESQEVLAAFLTLGHTGMSCDLYHDGAKGLPHYRGDIFDILGCGWDLVILHPPCTHLAVSGNRWYAGTKERSDAIAFVERLWDFPYYRGRLALENPVGVLSSQSKLGPATQHIQPYQFGHAESKKTGLWLRDLPPLVPTNILDKPACGYWENQTASGQNKLPPSPERQKLRSRTYTGIAQAMAAQWGSPP